MHGEMDDAVEYYSKIMTNDDVLLLKVLFQKMPHAPTRAKRYLKRHCRNVQELEDFFKDNDHLFFVENKRVALNDDELNTATEISVEYFREVLEGCEESVHFMELKTQYFRDAPDSAKNFISRFYPGREVKKFFKSHPDVFVVHSDHTVFLIETESVAFYERRLEIFGRKKFLDFRGHIGHASHPVQNFINKNYPGDYFQVFLKNHPDVFILDDEGFVSLVPLNNTDELI